MATHLVKLACEQPDKLGRSLSQWDCLELARQLMENGIVESISPDTVRRILEHHKLKPWRKHLWLTPKAPPDETFCATVRHICDLYTRPLAPHEVVLCVDEKTSLQPRTRLAPPQPAQPGVPVRVEHEYERKGALNLFAAFDTRTGKVYGQCHERKRQQPVEKPLTLPSPPRGGERRTTARSSTGCQAEFIQFLEYLDREIPAHVTLLVRA